MRARWTAARRRRSRGAVLVLVALMLPVLIGFAGLVVDVGNWFEHRRHLQTMADAAALAGAGSFNVPCSDAPILEMADAYSGGASADAFGFNKQVGDGDAQDRVLKAFNSETWPNQTDPVDDTVVTGGPCDAKMIDVKLTETDLPWFLNATRVVPFINAHARVEIRKQITSIGPLPVGVPEVDPEKAKAIFIDETTGAQIASVDLVKTGDSGGLSQWSNVDAPLSVSISTEKIGVRIVLSGSDSTTCGEPLVSCYDTGSTNGALLIRGYSATGGTATAPRVGAVNLSGGSCTDGYFSSSSSNCTVSVSAVVDFGTHPPPTGTRVWVKRQGANNSTAVEMIAPTAAGEPWTGGSFTVLPGEPANVELLWRTCPTGGCAISGATSLGVVHRTFGASDARSGPVRSARILDTSGVAGANNFATGTTQSLVVSIGVDTSLENAASVSDPVVTLKVAGGGSQNQALDCDPSYANLRDELAYGCNPSYIENDGVACPNVASALWSTAEPWKCVAISTGATTNQVPSGLNERIHGDPAPASCVSPNNWADFPNIPKGDPRIVELFLTPFGAFSGSGGTTVPVTGFATFYITGYAGAGVGFANPCEGLGDDPAGTGSIVGHFIKYIDTLNNGGAGEETCDFESFGRCVAVMTR